MAVGGRGQSARSRVERRFDSAVRDFCLRIVAEVEVVPVSTVSVDGNCLSMVLRAALGTNTVFGGRMRYGAALSTNTVFIGRMRGGTALGTNTVFVGRMRRTLLKLRGVSLVLGGHGRDIGQARALADLGVTVVPTEPSVARIGGGGQEYLLACGHFLRILLRIRSRRGDIGRGGQGVIRPFRGVSLVLGGHGRDIGQARALADLGIAVIPTEPGVTRVGGGGQGDICSAGHRDGVVLCVAARLRHIGSRGEGVAEVIAEYVFPLQGVGGVIGNAQAHTDMGDHLVFILVFLQHRDTLGQLVAEGIVGLEVGAQGQHGIGGQFPIGDGLITHLYGRAIVGGGGHAE